ncbi:MAG: two-component regulator propeller domain-containing protein [Breznakibacter sp.]
MQFLKIKCALLLATLGWFSDLHAQPRGYLELYADEHGLSQTANRVMQDSKGFIWLASYDGLIRYDGYEFLPVSPRASDSLQLQSIRVNDLMEDGHGRIWQKSNENEAFCYIPRCHGFWSLRSVPGYKNKPFRLTTFKQTPLGRVWLLSDRDGCVCVTDSQFQTATFALPDKIPHMRRVYDVHEDKNGHTWLLTDVGLIRINDDHLHLPRAQNINDMEVVMAGQPIFTAIEVGDDEVWFGGIKGKVWRYSQTGGRFTSMELNVPSDVTAFYRKSGNEILVMTRHDGFFICHLTTGKLTVYNSFTVKGLDTRNLAAICFDAPERLWLVNDRKGISQYDFSTGELLYYPSLIDDETFGKFTPRAFVLKDLDGNTWVQPKGGGFSFYEARHKRLLPMKDLSSDPSHPEVPVLHAACFDKQNNLWFYANRVRGIGKFTFRQNWFDRLAVADGDQWSLANNVRAIMEDDGGSIWIATKEESTLAIFDAHRKRLGYLSEKGTLGQMTNWKSPVYCMMQDRKRRIWIGTKGNGIFRLTPTRRPMEFEVEHFLHHPDNPQGLNNDGVYAICEDDRQRVWIGTWGGGLNLVDESNGTTRFIHHGNGLSNYPIGQFNRIRCIAVDSSGMFHVGTTNGLLSFKTNGTAWDAISYKWFAGFANHDVLGIVAHRSGDLYLTTYDGRLYRAEERDGDRFPIKFRNYSSYETHLSGALLAVGEDKLGQIWMCSEAKITRFDPQNQSFETYPDVKRMLSDNVFSEAAMHTLRNGELWVGYSNGVICFNPASLPVNNFKPYLALTGFQLLNQALDDTDGDPRFSSVDALSEIVLSHKQNFFKIRFAALDFAGKNNIRYKYRLDGLEDEWNMADDQRTATYTNVSKGEYVFRVASTNSNGVWIYNERKLRIVVKPAVWETYWAYAFYILLVFGLGALIFRTRLTIFRLRHEAKMEHELAEMKLDLFTDVSHEIRTPLTMVTAPVEYLVGHPETPGFVKQQLDMVIQSTQRLLALVNQILDIRKLEQKRLRIEEIDLTDFACRVCADFKDTAIRTHIELEVVCDSERVMVWADSDCLDKILVNLLANALKYCPQGSKVIVRAAEDGHYCFLSVEDNGPGIPAEKQERLFERFVGFSHDNRKPSSGIGLSLVKELAQRHGAQVRLQSQSGAGSVFTVVFRKGHGHFGNEVEWAIKPVCDDGGDQVLSTWGIFEERGNPGIDKPIGLIVEDDAKLRGFMRSILETSYQIHEAEDGVQGFQKALVLNPDFIISDIMMPNSDGIELLKRLRQEAGTSHIPLVLLTAKADVESKIDGLAHGADDYLTKPFSVSYFKARIDNLVVQRKRLHEFYKLGLAPMALGDEQSTPLITGQDKEMMEKAIAFVRSNIENEQLSVDELGKAVGLSRTTFFNKLKSLTGMSPVEFIRDGRLKHAARLIAIDKMLVKEACYSSGFSDLKYFGSCFKSKFGITPAEYRKKYLNNPDVKV